MYVCLCNNVTDREIRAAVSLGARTLGDLRDGLGVATCCGRCADCARSLLPATMACEAVACAGGDD
jgi:bacterioferritin-associated ferredoxin